MESSLDMTEVFGNDFDASQNNCARLDRRLLQDGAIKLYFKIGILQEDCRWLREHGYAIETIDCRDRDSFLRQMSIALRFKENYGYDEWTGNLNALNDALGDLTIDPNGGTVLCLQQYNKVKAADSDFAQAVLDVIECNSRNFLVSGRRLLALVQSDDPTIRFGSVGASSVLWNQREWFDSARGL